VSSGYSTILWNFRIENLAKRKTVSDHHVEGIPIAETGTQLRYVKAHSEQGQKNPVL
jgi:hypothetical protein